MPMIGLGTGGIYPEQLKEVFLIAYSLGNGLDYLQYQLE